METWIVVILAIWAGFIIGAILSGWIERRKRGRYTEQVPPSPIPIPRPKHVNCRSSLFPSDIDYQGNSTGARKHQPKGSEKDMDNFERHPYGPYGPTKHDPTKGSDDDIE